MEAVVELPVRTPVRTLDCAECGTNVTIPGVVWETTGTAPLGFLHSSRSRWLLGPGARMAEAFSCRLASAFRRRSSRRDSELQGWPKSARGFGQGAGGRASFSSPGALREPLCTGSGPVGFAPEGGSREPLPLQDGVPALCGKEALQRR